MNIVETLILINYYFFYKYNYKYGFCFYTKKIFSILPLDKAKCRIKLLKEEARIKKLNFVGSKSFLYPVFMYKLLCYRKEELGIESISIVSNSSKITKKFLNKNTMFTIYSI